MRTDAHCHILRDLQRDREHGELYKNFRMAPMATNLTDIKTLGEAYFSQNVIPGIGIHPWFSYLVSEGGRSKREHYKSVLEPEVPDEIIDQLPDPMPWEEYSFVFDSVVRRHATYFRRAVIGEIGLDRAFKVKINGEISPYSVKIEHQVYILEQHLKYAQEYWFPVSIHGVQVTQLLFEIVSKYELPEICLHSYGGGHEFYKTHWAKLDFPVYVSISALINGRMGERKLKLLLETVPNDLILCESDYHEPGQAHIDLIDQALDLVHKYTGMGPENIAMNYNEFFYVVPEYPTPPFNYFDRD